MKRFPFVWRKTAEADLQVWKDRAARQQRRAEKAESVARTEVVVRRQATAAYADLLDEFERVHGPLLTAPPAKPFTADRARQTAERLATARARRTRPYAPTAKTAEEATAP